MDSATLLYHEQAAGRLAAALSFDYGSKHNHRELPMAAALAARLGLRHEVVDISFLGRLFVSDLLTGGGQIPEGHYTDESMRSTVVPFRNGILLSIAAGFAESIGAAAVAIGAHAGDHTIYPDCRGPFLVAMDEAIRLGTYAEVRILRPFVDHDKAAIVRRGIELGLDFRGTWSCYKGGALHCGKCGTCVERREAFQLAGIEDPTEYEG